MSIEFIVSIDLRADKRISSNISRAARAAMKDDEDGYAVVGATSPNGKIVYVDVGKTWASGYAIASGLRRFLLVVDHEYAHALFGKISEISDAEEMMAQRFERAGMWARREEKPLRSQPPIV